MTQQDAIRKALACLRLSKSSNANEAALAASKAQEIIDLYKLDITGLDYDQQDATKEDNEAIVSFTHDPMDGNSDVNQSWCNRLASTVARANQCRIWLRRAPRPGCKTYQEIVIVGRPSDVATVRYLYSYLKQQVLDLKDKNTVGNSLTYKSQYCLGVQDTIRERMHAQHAETVKKLKDAQVGNSLALVRVNSAVLRLEKRGSDVEAFMASELDLRAGRRSGGTTTSEGMSARQIGRVHGHQVRMSSAKASIG